MTTTDEGPRARARAETTARALAIATRQLGEVGPAALSVRAIARELGIASSAIYRYFPSRDALLTRLIVDAYSELGEAATRAAAGLAGAARFRAVARAARRWSLDNPHRYALLYGTPVPGYDAPDDTNVPALTVAYLLMDSLLEAPGVTWPSLVPELAPGFSAVGEYFGREVPPEAAAAGVAVWTALFGRLSFEVFGQYTGVVEGAAAREAWFEVFLDGELARVGL